MSRRIKHADDGPRGYSDRSGFASRPGEEHTVDDERAERLLKKPYFEPVDGEADDASGDAPMEGLADRSHDELKEAVENAGIADEVDLRSKQAIIDSLREHEAVDDDRLEE